LIYASGNNLPAEEKVEVKILKKENKILKKQVQMKLSTPGKV
jgi:hypothetical protein